MYRRPGLAMLMILIAFLTPPVAAEPVLPHEFGERLPVYPDARPGGIRYTRDSVTVTFSSTDSYTTVRGFYLQTLPAYGWQVFPGEALQATVNRVLTAESNGMQLTLHEASQRSGPQKPEEHAASFVIRIFYRGGRE